MRRSYFTLLATISLTALLGIPVLSAAEPKNFGTLKPQDEWRVGTVDGEGTEAGAPYCAMVDRYEGDIFLAFARDANGYGSLALDFAEDLFKQELEYQIAMTPGKGKAGSFTGRATTPRSLVVQVGKDKSFYDGLTDSGTLDVSMPVMKVAFGLKGFTASYKDLVDCAASLGAPVKVAAEPPVQIAAAEAAKPAAKAAPVEEPVKQEEKANIDWAEPAAPAANSERKLLASTKTMTPPTEEILSLPPAGVSAQDLEKHQLAAVQERPAPVAAKAEEKAAAPRSATASAPILIGQQPIDRQLAQVAVNTPRAVVAEKKLEEREKEMAEMQAKLEAAEKARMAAEKEKASIAEKVEKQRLAETEKKLDAVAQKDFEEQMKRAEEKRLAEEEKVRFATAEKARMEADLIAAEKARIEAEKMAAAAKETEKKKAGEKVAEQKPAEVATAMPAVPSVPVVQENILAPANNNRAAAFLDKIMGYHRKPGAAAPHVPAPVQQVQAPVVSAPPVMAAAAPAPAPTPVTPPEEEKSFFDFLKSEPIKPKVVVQPEPAPAPQVVAKVEEIKPEPAPVVVAKVEERQPEPVIATPVPVKVPENAALSLPPPMDREVKPVILSGAAATSNVPVLSKSALAEEKKPAEPAAFVPPLDLLTPPAFDPASVPMPEPAPIVEPVKIAEKPLERRVPLEPTPDLAALQNQKMPEPVKSTPLSVSEPAPIKAEPPVAISQPVPLSQPVEPLPDVPKPLMAKKEESPKPVPAPEPAAAPAAPAGPVTLERLLDNAGLRNAQFVAVNTEPGETVRQWRARNLNGMYEKTSEGQGNFNAETQNYLDRYREDCPGHLDVTIGETRIGMAGSFAPAVVSCTLPSNSYTTSFVFIQNPESFGAVAHSGRPGDVATVKAVGDDIVRALLAAKKFTAPEPLVKKPAAVPVAAAPVPAPTPVAAAEVIPAVQLKPLQPAITPKKQLRFNIPEAKSAKSSSEFPTVVIE